MVDWWQDPNVLITIVGSIVIPLLVLCTGLLIRHYGSHKDFCKDIEHIKGSLDELRVDMKEIRPIVKGWEMMSRLPEFIDAVKGFTAGHGNPYNPERKNYLLDKYSRQNLTLAEAQELQRYVEDDYSAASGAGAGLAVILAIIAVLVGLGALIWLLSRGEE